MLAGSGNVVRATTVSNATACAFLMFDASRIENCTVSRCAMGIVNLAAGSELVSSRVIGNGGFDVIDLGSLSFSGESVLGKVHADAVSFPEFTDLREQGYRSLDVPLEPR